MKTYCHKDASHPHYYIPLVSWSVHYLPIMELPDGMWKETKVDDKYVLELQQHVGEAEVTMETPPETVRSQTIAQRNERQARRGFIRKLEKMKLPPEELTRRVDGWVCSPNVKDAPYLCMTPWQYRQERAVKRKKKEQDEQKENEKTNTSGR